MDWNFEECGCVDLWVEADLTTNRVDAHLEGERFRELAEGSSAKDAAGATRTRLEDALQVEAALCAALLASRSSDTA